MDPSTDDIERATVCIKKSSKGPFWQSRYLRTKMNHLLYWRDLDAYTRDPWSPSADFDICDFKVIEYKVGRFVNLMYSDEGKFGLHLQFTTENEAKEWYESLLAKKGMYSVHQFMVEMNQGVNRCVTQQFAQLLVLSEVEQSRWISEHIEEQFSMAQKTSSRNVKGQINDEIVSICAARRCLEEFIKTCDDCSTEMRQRNPKIQAHCKRYIGMYERLLTGRLILQLSCIVPPSSKRTTQKRKMSELGESVLCEAIAFMDRIEKLKTYVFLNQDTYKSVTETVFTCGELVGGLLDLSIERVEAWFASLNSLPVSYRAARMLEIKTVLLGVLSESHLEMIAANDSSLQTSLYVRIITSALLTFHDQLAAVDFAVFGEEGLVAHINACEEIRSSFQTGILSWEVPSSRPLSTHTVPQSKFFAAAGVLSEESGSSNASSKEGIETFEMAVPTPVLDSVSDICLLSARSASAELVINIGRASSPMLLDGLIVSSRKVDSSGGWLGGSACGLLVDHFKDWNSSVVSRIPPLFGEIVSRETGRLMVRMYMLTLIKRYTGDKSLKLDSAGVSQMDQDLASLHGWIVENVLLSDSRSDDDKACSKDLQMEEIHLISAMREFLCSSHELLLESFGKAVLNFGSAQGLQVYDILRLALKVRQDLSNKVRKNILGTATEYLNMLLMSLASDPELMCGSDLSREGRQVRIIDELCPYAGTEHCTGKKWSLEVLSNPSVARLAISQVIQASSATARKQREERERERGKKPPRMPAAIVTGMNAKPLPTRELRVETMVSKTAPQIPLSPSVPEFQQPLAILQNKQARRVKDLRADVGDFGSTKTPSSQCEVETDAKASLPLPQGKCSSDSVESSGVDADTDAVQQQVDPALYAELDSLYIEDQSDEEKVETSRKTAAPPALQVQPAPPRGPRVFAGGSNVSAVPVPIPAKDAQVLRHVDKEVKHTRRTPPLPPPISPSSSSLRVASIPAAERPVACPSNPFDADDGDDEDSSSASPPIPSQHPTIIASASRTAVDESLVPLPVARIVSGSGPAKLPPPKPPRNRGDAGQANAAELPIARVAVTTAAPQEQNTRVIPSFPAPVAVSSEPVARPNPFEVPTLPQESTYAPALIGASRTQPPNPFAITGASLIDRPIRGVAGSTAADEANRQAAIRRQRSSLLDRLNNA